MVLTARELGVEQTLPVTKPVAEVPGPRREYQRRLDASRALHARQNQLEGIVGNARVAVFVLGLVAVYLVFVATRIAAAWLAVPVVAFFILLKLHERIRRGLKRGERATAFYERGLERLEDRWAGRGDPGTPFLSEEHPYTLDLDIFGAGSLYERLCTARTRAGCARLAQWLRAPATPEEIRARQGAVADLRDRLDLRESLALLASDVAPPSGRRKPAEVSGPTPAAQAADVDLDALARWGEAPTVLASSSLRWSASIIVVTGLAALTGWLTGDISLTFYLLILLIQGAFAFALKSRVDQIIAPVERRAHDLALFAGILARIESESFQSPRLRQLQADLEVHGARPSQQIRKLVNLVHWLDCKHDQYFAMLAPLVLWTTQLAFAFEAWRSVSGAGIRRWLDAVAQFEALSSLAAYAYECPDDPFPEIADSGLSFDGADLGHPLIPAKRCVRNDVRLDADMRVLVVSGSNMSGKSTLLRTVGVNAVLAQAGAPVRAGRLRLSPLAIGATLRIQDSLQAGRSRFFAEITRLRELVDLAKGPLPLLFLLDEVLHGTNSHDRRLGAESVVRGLVELGGIGLITTHDLALTHIADQLAPRAANVHFEDHFENGTMTFDYRMRPGVVQKSNALELMRAVGLKV